MCQPMGNHSHSRTRPNGRSGFDNRYQLEQARRCDLFLLHLFQSGLHSLRGNTIALGELEVFQTDSRFSIRVAICRITATARRGRLISSSPWGTAATQTIYSTVWASQRRSKSRGIGQWRRSTLEERLDLLENILHQHLGRRILIERGRVEREAIVVRGHYDL